MPAQFTTGPNGKLTPKPGTTLNGKGAPTSDADQFDPRGRNQIPMGSSGKYGGGNVVSEQGNTQQTKKSQNVARVLKFPVNRTDMYPAHIVFHPYKIDTGLLDGLLGDVMNTDLVTTVKGEQTSESVNDEVSSSQFNDVDEEGGTFTSDEIQGAKDAQTRQRENANRQQNAANRAQINKEIKENQAVMGSKLTDLKAYRDPKAPAIQLFFPPSLQYNDAVNYNSANLGSAGLTAMGALNSGENIMSAITSGLTEGMESIFNLATGSLKGESMKVGAARLAKKFSGGTSSAVQSALQTGMNPGTRLLFDQPTMRSFTFSFKLIPTSSQEAITIKEIVKNFRFQMYPREIDVTEGIPIGYEFPNVYRIEFAFDGGTLQIPKIQYCYLKDVQAAYNSTSGGVFFEDGHPTEIDLNLTFLEYRALSKRDVEAGF